jgi:hypothetical protein
VRFTHLAARICWFLNWLNLRPEDGSNIFLRNVWLRTTRRYNSERSINPITNPNPVYGHTHDNTLMALSITTVSIQRQKTGCLNNELQRTWKEAVGAQFKTLAQHMPTEIKEDHGKKTEHNQCPRRDSNLAFRKRHCLNQLLLLLLETRLVIALRMREMESLGAGRNSCVFPRILTGIFSYYHTIKCQYTDKRFPHPVN